MSGMNARTGRRMFGLSHLYQSIGKILTTPLGSRIERRSFGSELPDLIDAPNNAATRVRLYAAIATALMRQEPRLTLTRVSLGESIDSSPVIDIEGVTSETGETVAASVLLTNEANT